MRIVFIGCVKSSEAFLQATLLTKAQVVGVITAKDSGINADFADLSMLSEKYGIDICYTEDVNNESTVGFIREKKPDVIYCFGWSRLIKGEILSIPPLGVIGYHPAALPHNRGRHPIIWALALGLPVTASTFFRMDRGADTGDILSQEQVDISFDDDATSLYSRLLVVGTRQIQDFTEKLAEGTAVFVPQNLDEGNTWRKRGICDGQIDWRMSCEAIYNLVRALTYPYIGAHLIYKGTQYKVWRVRIVRHDSNEINRDICDCQNIEPGKILWKKPKSIGVKAYDGIIEIIDCDSFDACEGEYL